MSSSADTSVAGSTPSPLSAPPPSSAGTATARREIRRRLAAERARLEIESGLRPPADAHYRRPAERPFPAGERSRTTILIGGLTELHNRFIRAAFEGAGYRCESLPVPDLECFHVGREYCNNGQCNPAYFTIGGLVHHLQQLEATGLSRRQIVDEYVFFTAGSCGPCRFGMYESEYRLALEHAGFDGFRVLTFQQSAGVRPGNDAGLELTPDFGFAALSAFNLGDVLGDLGYQIRPYEVVPGETDRAVAECAEVIEEHLRRYSPGEPDGHLPGWLLKAAGRHRVARTTVRLLWKHHQHAAGQETARLLAWCRDRLDRVAVDRTRVKPIVKITGEFWAQTTEGDGNYRMFSFLEREGAQVRPEPLGAWVSYLLFHGKSSFLERQRLEAYEPVQGLRAAVIRKLKAWARLAMFDLGEWMYNRDYERAVRMLGGLGHHLVSQAELARLARPYYHPLARGGEGHQEVGKNIYYTANRLCHMVLSLKPFGCLPSSQSDGVQAAVIDRFRDMVFLPVETSGEGEVLAHSRVQMSLADARANARREFDQALAATGRRLGEIQAYVEAHPELSRPFYAVPRRPGVAGVAANFVRHVADLMDRDRTRSSREAWRAAARTAGCGEVAARPAS